MASKALSNPLLRYVSKRGYSGGLVMPAVKEARMTSAVLPNGTFVASLDNGSPVTRVTVAFKAGSRYEPQNEIGVAHLLRCAAGLSTGNASNFIIARKLAQIGASVTASGDREFIYYTLETTHDNLNCALECLNNMVSNQEFRPWEVSDITPRLKYDIVSLWPQVRAVDLLHKAAYRRGLGNSLFISPKRIGAISSESLQHYAGSTLSPKRCAVAVVGETQEKAQLLAQALQLPSVGAEAPTAPTKYYGGEMRKEMGGELAHVALAVCGAAVGSKQSLAFAVAAKALGNGPITKWGADNSPLAKAIGNIGPFGAAGFNVSYSDAGLYGVVLTVPKDEAGAAVKSVAAVLKKPSLSNEAIKAGKKQLILQVLSESEAATNLSESVAAQGLYTGSALTPGDLAKQIDAIPESDIITALGSAAQAPLAMGAAGNLTCCPYVDEL